VHIVLIMAVVVAVVPSILTKRRKGTLSSGRVRAAGTPPKLKSWRSAT
jgi:hypothetical protein